LRLYSGSYCLQMDPAAKFSEVRILFGFFVNSLDYSQ